MMQEQQGQIKGRARLYVSQEVAPPEMKIPSTGEITYGNLPVPELFERWHSYLLLPEHYTLLGVYFDTLYYQWLLIIESDTIPLPKQEEMLPIIMPVYSRSAEGVVSILKLDLLEMGK